jgi:hypothetical protein
MPSLSLNLPIEFLNHQFIATIDYTVVFPGHRKTATYDAKPMEWTGKVILLERDNREAIRHHLEFDSSPLPVFVETYDFPNWLGELIINSHYHTIHEIIREQEGL